MDTCPKIVVFAFQNQTSFSYRGAEDSGESVEGTSTEPEVKVNLFVVSAQ